MEHIDSYKDIVEGIEIHKKIINAMEEEIYIITKMMFAGAPRDISGINYSGLPGGNFSPISLDRLVERLQKLKERLEMEKQVLQKLEKQKEKIDERISKLEGLRYKVAYMREIEGKGLQEIANELGYSYQHIANINSENRKMIVKYNENNMIK